MDKVGGSGAPGSEAGSTTGFWNYPRTRGAEGPGKLSPGTEAELVYAGPPWSVFYPKCGLTTAALPTKPDLMHEKPKLCPSAHSSSLPPALQELEEVYQDAASNVLLAICRHSWQVVAQHLETEVLTGVFPHRSLLYVMGILTSNGMSCPRGLRHPPASPWPPSAPRP